MKKNKLNVENINEITFYGKKVIKILLFLLVMLAIYSVVLINKEWKVLNIVFRIFSVISPLFWGILIAYLFNPLINRMTRGKLNRAVATSIVYIVLLLGIYLLGSYLFPSMGKEINDLLQYLPSVFDSVNEFLNNIVNKLKIDDIIEGSIIENVKNTLNAYLIEITTDIPSKTIAILSTFVSKIGILLLSLIISFYLLIDFDRGIENIYLFIPNKYRENTHTLLSNISEQVFSFIKGTGFVFLLVTIVSFVSFQIAGLKGALFFAIWNAGTNIIPYIGPYIGGVPIVAFAFATDYKLGIVVLIIVIMIQLVESYILHPIVMSKTMKLHPVTIIIGLLVFGHFFGIIGMLIATPATAILKTIWLFVDEKYKITFRLENKNDRIE